MAYSDTGYDRLRPGRFFEEAGGIIAEVSFFKSVVAGTTGSVLVSAVTGKKIRVLSLNLVAVSTASTALITSATPGAYKFGAVVPANTVATPNQFFTADPKVGLFETDSGEGLYLDTGAGGAVWCSIHYIIFTP